MGLFDEVLTPFLHTPTEVTKKTLDKSRFPQSLRIKTLTRASWFHTDEQDEDKEDTKTTGRSQTFN